MKVNDLFLEPEVLHEQLAGPDAAQATQLCRLEPGCYIVRQTTRWDDGTKTEHRQAGR